MAVVLSEVEGTPAAWPDVTPYPIAAEWSALDPQNPTLDPATVWRVVERWVTTRWRSRSLVYVVEGPGSWSSRLTPFTLTGAERWDGAGWVNETLTPAPLGYALDDFTYRVTGTVGGSGDVPEDVQEAWRRLHSYLLGSASEHLDQTASYREGETERPRAHAAQALRLSGAADLLRNYRRLG